MNAKTVYSIQAHLPEKLTISFWLFNYFQGAGEGDFYHDLEKRIIELKRKGVQYHPDRCGDWLCYGKNGVPGGRLNCTSCFWDTARL